MSGGYILPNGEFQEDTSLETTPESLPVDSVCGTADVIISVADTAQASENLGG
jgi:hypothetical protein